MAEGSNWEAMNFASFYKLDNLTAIIDINRLGQSSGTIFEHDMNNYKKKFESFGFHTIVVDGHKVKEIASALANKKKGKPQAILAKTIKGKYFLD